MGASKPIFRDLNADDPEPEATEIESLCVNCHANGITRLLLTKIPFYKEVVLMSFSCEHCGFENNEIQSGAAISPEGVKISLRVETQADLNRQLVKSDYTSIKIVELDFEIPAKSQKGEVTTVEGVITRSIAGLQQDQPVRRIQHPEAAAQIDEFIQKLEKLKDLNSPFTLILEDISGNSFIENPQAPKKDPNCSTHFFKRTKEQDHELGIFTPAEVGNEKSTALLHPISENEFTLEDLEGEVLQFPTNCTNCNSPCETNMKMTKIPHFKEVVIMATNCDACGHRTNEVKSGGGIEPTGVHIEVFVNGREDFSRDVLKSETCSLKIPELELEVGPHALGGRFTTVEGLLVAIKEQLDNPTFSHMFGDSQTAESKARLEEFFKRLQQVLDGEFKVTIVLDDPAGNSYIQSLDDEDKGLKITQYERTFEQNEELGLNDMKTENYTSD
ncbi:zinc finger protein ZPR1 [Tribolium castaneum]|uniref:Zinc finger protein ZPR1 n=1 Tax=Tribolium castaneum TaxID=7070 RepID=D6WR96_TRICA|nr:PREDICTED: zinc finger protein ZPR1 [Tribolium castaneum]XP_975557.1 PREDICTED: zinc finger protein ZPR1 [Tribolium castaneum]EFA05991.1 Zinc finger protein ZPR1-like Protein [Tribolium castaneum]|eukprot:XP_015837369.1 PREDICTED: zinc finger protein ZPR1 [Tribolium castaneum]